MRHKVSAIHCSFRKAIPLRVKRPGTAAEEESQPPETAAKVWAQHCCCTRARNCCTPARGLKCHAHARALWLLPAKLACALRADPLAKVTMQPARFQILHSRRLPWLRGAPHGGPTKRPEPGSRASK